jgi:hypothetical protein
MKWKEIKSECVLCDVCFRRWGVFRCWIWGDARRELPRNQTTDDALRTRHGLASEYYTTLYT